MEKPVSLKWPGKSRLPTAAATTNGRWVKTETDNGGTTVTVVDTEYDSCACSPPEKMKRVSQPYAPGGTVYWTTYTYDGLGRTISVSLPGNTGTTTYVYEGDTVKVTEPNPAGGADVETGYTYNPRGRLVIVTMTWGGGTQTRTFSYDWNTDRLMSVTTPESGTVSYTYGTNPCDTGGIGVKGSLAEVPKRLNAGFRP